MKQTIKDAFSSKKFLAFISTGLVYAAGRWGLNIDPSALDRLLALTAVYITGQGIADFGKSAAIVTAGGPALAPAKVPEGGS